MSPFRVLIAGAGVASVETLLALRHLAADRVEIDLLAPASDFVYRPLSVMEPFGGGEPPRVPIGTIAREHDAGHVFDSLESVDADRHTIHTAGGETFGYQVLVVATGARPAEALRGSLTFPGTATVDEFRRLLGELASGSVRSVAFAVPRDVTWALPLYELALMTATYLRRRAGRAAELAVITPEKAPLIAFGERASTTVGELLRQHSVALHAGVVPDEAEPSGVRLEDGRVIPAERVVALPALVGAGIAGLPTEAGFVPVDDHGQVRGTADIYAAGDVTTWIPKQGGLATQQADVVAEAIAERVGAPVRPSQYRPVLRGIMFTGEESAHLRSDVRGDHQRSIAALRPLWWPPAKLAGRYLAPYLAARGISAAVR